MNMIRIALRKPISTLVLVFGLLFFGIKVMQDVRIDILPEMNLPVVYVAHSFNGYTPEQMEGYFTKMYTNMMLFTNGIKDIETKNSQGLTLMKVTFYPDTDMGQAIAELSALSNRSQIFLPPGTPDPFIIRFDASSQPVGQVVFRSPSRTNDQLQDIANFTARPFLISVPGITTAPPFGGSPRTIEVNVNPQAMRVHNLSPEDIVEAISRNNITAPSGNLFSGNTNYITPTNNIIRSVTDFETIPLNKGTVNTLLLRDVAEIKDGADIATGYALINGKRSVYINVAKSGNASTWDVVNNLKKQLPIIQNNLPEDVTVSFEFDQSVYVISAVKNLLLEALIGAILTGLMVLLFLGDKRSAFIVILTIPISLLSSVLFLHLFGYTLNIMSLSGLALAIGILVDESTVTIENIHRHLEMGKSKARAIWDASSEIAFPKLLILLCIMAAFVPALLMDGIPGAMFKPLALAICFAMITSFLLSQTLVPVLSSWLIQPKTHAPANADGSTNTDNRLYGLIAALLPHRKLISVLYLALSVAAVFVLMRAIGTDVLPQGNAHQFQVRMVAPQGTRIEVTENKVRQFTNLVEELVGPEHIRISSSFVGQHSSTFAVSPIYLYNAGPHEATIQIALQNWKGNIHTLKEELRERVNGVIPDVSITFEPMELSEKVLSQGANTPIEVRFSGMMKPRNEMYAKQLMQKLKQLDYMRDVRMPQSTAYPTVNIEVDRLKAGQLGLDMADVTNSLVPATSSSRFTNKNLWIGGMMNMAYNVQVQVPQQQMASIEELESLSISKSKDNLVLRDVATITRGTTYGETYNMGSMSYTTVIANIHNKDLGTAVADVRKAIAQLGELPKGLNVHVAGLAPVLEDTQRSLRDGVIIAIIVIFLLLAANFQSFRVASVVVASVPAVITGAILMLMSTHATLNMQSYMGIIMSVGVSISNALLLVTAAENIRKEGADSATAALRAVKLRLRPILMTAIATIVGMLPMAIGFGEGGAQTAPLGRAVIGGIIMSTAIVLVVLPLIFAWVQNSAKTQSVSLDPEDPNSKFYQQ
ncbi:MAG: efflux RND transporter permease subunit [Marinifilaceae bacterium]